MSGPKRPQVRDLDTTGATAAPGPRDRWSALPPFRGEISGDSQVLIVAATGGAKSTLAATLTLDVRSLVAIDEKGALRLPRSRLLDLPPSSDPSFGQAVADGLAWRDGGPATNRVVVRPHPTDIDGFAAHDVIFAAIYARGHTLAWIDEITATGATPTRVQPWLRAISARGRTRGIGLLTLTQAAFGLVPVLLRRNANVVVFGPMEPQDVAEIRRSEIEIATEIAPKTGRFLAYRSGDRAAYRLYLPIPPALDHWRAP